MSISTVNEFGLLYSKRVAYMPAGEEEKTVVRIRGGSLGVSTGTGGCCVRWKHWENTPKICVIDIRVYLF